MYVLTCAHMYVYRSCILRDMGQLMQQVASLHQNLHASQVSNEQVTYVCVRACVCAMLFMYVHRGRIAACTPSVK